jgi:uncharacterized protein YecT (DUF1311 family)
MSFASDRIITHGLRGIAILLFIGHTSIACAQKTKVPEKPCGDYGTQSEINDCAAREAHNADEALNSIYKKLLRRLEGDKTATARVITAEKAWIAFRDAELAADWPLADGENPNFVYGSVHPLCYYNERAALTLDRSKTLSDRMRHEEEGNLCSTEVASQRGHSDSSLSCGTSVNKQNSLLKRGKNST